MNSTLDKPVMTKTKDPVMFLAATLLYLSRQEGFRWLTTESKMSLKLLSLTIDAIDLNQEINLNAAIRSPNNQTQGTFTKRMPADAVRNYWVDSRDTPLVRERVTARARQILDLPDGSAPAKEPNFKAYTWDDMRAHLDLLYDKYGPLLDSKAWFKPSVPGMRHPDNATFMKDNALSCDCDGAIKQSCNHVLYAYTQGADAYFMKYKFLKANKASLMNVPIGFGYYMLPVSVSRLQDEDTGKDVPFLLVHSNVEKTVLNIMGITEDSPFIMSEGDTVLQYILYLEDLVLSLRTFPKVDDAESMNMLYGGAGCKYTHRPNAMNIHKSATRKSNPRRLGWLIANRVSALDTNTCLACIQLEIGQFDVPQVR